MNEAYLSDPDKIDILNVCINLNFGYETESERVQYGVIPYMSENTDKNPSALESPETVNIYKNSLEEREKFAKEMESYFYTQYDQLLASGTPYQNRLSQLLLPDSHWYKTHDIETWSVEKAFFHVFFPSYLSSSSEVLTEENTQIYNGFSSMIETLTLDEVKKLESCVNTLGTSPERDIMLLRFLDMYGKV